MSEPTESDCTFTRDIICPYCGHVHGDSWEWGDGEGDYEDECFACDKTFQWSRNVSITYSTRRKDQ